MLPFRLSGCRTSSLSLVSYFVVRLSFGATIRVHLSCVEIQCSDSGKKKHTEIHMHYIRGLIHVGVIDLQYWPILVPHLRASGCISTSSQCASFSVAGWKQQGQGWGQRLRAGTGWVNNGAIRVGTGNSSGESGQQDGQKTYGGGG